MNSIQYSLTLNCEWGTKKKKCVAPIFSPVSKEWSLLLPWLKVLFTSCNYRFWSLIPNLSKKWRLLDGRTGRPPVFDELGMRLKNRLFSQKAPLYDDWLVQVATASQKTQQQVRKHNSKSENTIANSKSHSHITQKTYWDFVKRRGQD